MAREIDGFTDDPKQRFQLSIGEPDDNYASADILMTYSEPRKCWYIDLTWNDFDLKGLKVSSSQNILRDFRNLIPFGLLVYGLDKADPMTLETFEDKKHFMWLLTQQEALELA